MAEIRDEDTLKAWLADKPQDWAVAIAVRAALRALPELHWSSDLLTGNAMGHLVITTFRCTLISGVAAVRPTPEIEAAATTATATRHRHHVECGIP